MVPAKKMTHGFQVGASLEPKGLVVLMGIAGRQAFWAMGNE